MQDSPEGGIVILKIKKEDNIDKMWESILFAMVGKYTDIPILSHSKCVRDGEQNLTHLNVANIF